MRISDITVDDVCAVLGISPTTAWILFWFLLFAYTANMVRIILVILLADPLSSPKPEPRPAPSPARGVALLLGLHARCGASSPLHVLPNDVLRWIIQIECGVELAGTGRSDGSYAVIVHRVGYDREICVHAGDDLRWKCGETSYYMLGFTDADLRYFGIGMSICSPGSGCICLNIAETYHDDGARVPYGDYAHCESIEYGESNHREARRTTYRWVSNCGGTNSPWTRPRCTSVAAERWRRIIEEEEPLHGPRVGKAIVERLLSMPGVCDIHVVDMDTKLREWKLV